MKDDNYKYDVTDMIRLKYDLEVRKALEIVTGK